MKTDLFKRALVLTTALLLFFSFGATTDAGKDRGPMLQLDDARGGRRIAHPVPLSALIAVDVFKTADVCMSCHNGLVTSAGEDVSFGTNWRATMMANSARDPYWHAAVRREVADFPEAQSAIEDECSTCHMPMASFTEKQGGGAGQVFAHLVPTNTPTAMSQLAMDGVSCTVCHGITDEGLGSEESFTGHFKVDTSASAGMQRIFGPFAVDDGRSTIMRSVTDFSPTEAAHIQQSELCASCHTLYTNALGPGGEVIGELPEQVPYLEWKHSAYPGEASCQTCHMPVVDEDMPIASVLGEPRAGYSRHSFRGGNFFMLRIFNRYRDELGVAALPSELDRAALETVLHLQTKSAILRIDGTTRDDGILVVPVGIENLAGHKLPSAYPSRRAWIHFTVTDGTGSIVFESGRLNADGSITGNDNDADPATYEVHYEEISSPDQVQVYEAILAGRAGGVTTGLLTATHYLKDNRLLPSGFVNATADADISVKGGAVTDKDFAGGGDRVAYRVDARSGDGPFEVTAELWYQPIGFRWARNLEEYDTAETNRFSRYYASMSEASGVRLATVTAVID